MHIIVKPISKELTDDFLNFFDNAAFSDNKEWSGCYCCFYHFDGSDSEWEKRTGENNRLSAIGLIQEGKMNGYLAYLEGEPIGWCNVNDKASFPRLMSVDESCNGADEKICSIVCFIIAPEYRRMGVASQILNVICNDCSKKGYEYIEAYPRKGDLTSAQHYHGPLSMYIKKGFSIYRTLDSYDIVRKKL